MRRLWGVTALLMLAACGGGQRPADEQLAKAASSAEPLKVLLYPYLPKCEGHEGFDLAARRLEREFEARTGHVAAVEIADPDWALYDSKKVAGLLDRGVYDVIEIDTELLGEVVLTGAVRPWARVPAEADWHPAARQAVQLAGAPGIYGIPHYLCGYFIYSRSPEVVKASTSAALGQALDALGTPRINLVGDGMGGWTLSSLYLDAWAELHPDQPASAGLSRPLDEAAARSVTALISLCKHEGRWPCTEEAAGYHLSDLPAQIFGRGEADALWGYSERLHHVIRAAREAGVSTDDIYVAPAPLHSRQRMMTFTDALLLREGCAGECAARAEAFAEYLLSPATLEWLLMADECPEDAPPRYLLPAVKRGFTERLQADRFYRVFKEAMEAASPFPNQGLEAIRDEIEAGVNAAMGVK